MQQVLDSRSGVEERAYPADGMRGRHKAGAKVFEIAGGFAPTMGVLGTVMGLISALQKLDQTTVETFDPKVPDSPAEVKTLRAVFNCLAAKKSPGAGPGLK